MGRKITLIYNPIFTPKDQQTDEDRRSILQGVAHAFQMPLPDSLKAAVFPCSKVPADVPFLARDRKRDNKVMPEKVKSINK